MSRNNKRSSRAERRTRTQERMKKEGESSGGSQIFNLPPDTDSFKANVGTFNLDLVPYKVKADNNPFADPGELIHGRIIFVHYGLGPEKTSVICPKTIGKRCPVCEYVATLDWDENEDDIRDLRHRKRVIYNVIDIDDDADKILFWVISYGNFEELLAEEYAAAGDDDVILGLDFLDDRPQLEVRFKEDKFGKNTYICASKITASQGEDFNEDILEDVVDLDECLIVLSADEIQKIFYGLDEGETPPEQESEKEEKTPSRRGRRGKKSEDKEKEEQTEEAEKTSSRRRTSRKKKEEQEKEEKEPSSRRRGSAKEKEEKEPSSGDGSTCPSGHEWGKDNDAFPKDCDQCDSWNDCMDMAERLQNE